MTIFHTKWRADEQSGEPGPHQAENNPLFGCQFAIDHRLPGACNNGVFHLFYVMLMRGTWTSHTLQTQKPNHKRSPSIFRLCDVSGQIIATSAEVTPNGGLVRESHQNPFNSGLGIIQICPDVWMFPAFCFVGSIDFKKHHYKESGPLTNDGVLILYLLVLFMLILRSADDSS